MVEYRKFITRQMLRDEPTTLFVFGDNFLRKGFGGQAKEMRGEPNAVGIPTKRFPNMSPESFLTESDFDEWSRVSENDFTRLHGHAVTGGKIVWPLDGIGTGLAKLQVSAPSIYQTIETFKSSLTRGY